MLRCGAGIMLHTIEFNQVQAASSAQVFVLPDVVGMVMYFVPDGGLLEYVMKHGRLDLEKACSILKQVSFFPSQPSFPSTAAVCLHAILTGLLGPRYAWPRLYSRQAAPQAVSRRAQLCLDCGPIRLQIACLCIYLTVVSFIHA